MLMRGEPSLRRVPMNATLVWSNCALARAAMSGAAASNCCHLTSLPPFLTCRLRPLRHNLREQGHHHLHAILHLEVSYIPDKCQPMFQGVLSTVSSHADISIHHGQCERRPDAPWHKKCGLRFFHI